MLYTLYLQYLLNQKDIFPFEELRTQYLCNLLRRHVTPTQTTACSVGILMHVFQRMFLNAFREGSSSVRIQFSSEVNTHADTAVTGSGNMKTQ